MDSKKAIIDLGSNTFHLMIVLVDRSGGYSVIHKERSFVGLAENGIEVLSDAAMERGIIALKHFATILDDHQVLDRKIIGTSALRSAKNSGMFLARVREDLGLEIEVIDGTREAKLIHKGVAQVVDMSKGSHIIMDVGGGSVEFILVENGKMEWCQSLDLGVGVLYNLYPISDPISTSQVLMLEAYIEQALKGLRDQIGGRSITSLVGASGSFEVVQSINGDPVQDDKASLISMSTYHQVAEKLIRSTIAQRQEMEGLPESRVKLIVVAMVLINTAVDLINPHQIQVSPYALKEGVISELTANSK